MSANHQIRNSLNISDEGGFILEALSKKIDDLFARSAGEFKELREFIRKQNAVPEKEHYRPAEVCERLGISRGKFEHMKREGVFKPERVGRHVYIDAQQLKRLFPKDF